MKKLLFLLFLIVFSFGEHIKKYDVFVKVDRNGKLYVVEEITYNFENHRKHGIYRFIPYLRGEAKNINVVMDNIKTQPVKISKNQTDVIIRIGSANNFVTGIHKYRISYTMDKVVRTFNENLNTIRFNAIGTEWKIPIFNITIKIRLDSIFNRNDTNLDVFSGVYGSTNKISYKNKGKTEYLIKVPYVPSRNGITFQLTFNKSLIMAEKPPTQNLYYKWIWLFIIIYSLGLYFYWNKHGREPKMGAVAPQYYPLEDLDVLEVGLLLDEVVDEQDISPAILELATKGYIKIEVEDSKNGIGGMIEKVLNTRKVILHKIKNPDEKLSPFLRELFFALFGNRDSFELGQKNEQVAKTLKSKIKHLKENLYQWSANKGYMVENPEKARTKFLILSLLIASPFIMYAIYNSFNIMSDETKFFTMFAVFLFIWLIISYFFIKNKVIKYAVVGFLSFGIFLDVNVITSIFTTYPFPTILVVFIPIFMFYKNMGARTRKGTATLRYLLGFKEFVEKVESNKIRLLLKEDPKYLDKTLPYAVLFGVSEHWFKFYIELEQTPLWYNGNRYGLHNLNDTIYNGFNTTEHYSESSSGGFSGGGFSGGGSGGGGGGSW